MAEANGTLRDQIGTELIALRTQLAELDVAAPVTEANEVLCEHLTDHVDTAMVGVLRLVDGRLHTLRTAVAEAAAAAAPPSPATRPLVTGDQVRKAVVVVRDAVASAGRSRRERWNGQRSLESRPPAA